ncbi:DUF3095 domain-containing protein [Aquibium sp. ELW1220]|uniref:DUF3095 domain-containing protein n=1 Tax=Aquibium sp. ELW1220 TaxID=2976766 RepID=UPI0025AF9DEE|nr:DUF3095 domain-containing protein [Aquibium sp. ELW1220]MDN2582794.1 DUF3095 domain-containing protein [Aquibium sp. ELW1220]
MANPLPDDFYARLKPESEFDRLADAGAYVPLPDDWYVGSADIVGSTAHIAAGRYKTVNTVGAAVVSAQMNAAGGMTFPFVFGGDGAGFAFPPSHLDRAQDALARVLRWADQSFGFEMRGAIVPVADIRAAGFDVSVARYRPSPTIDYAMFAGGGLAWAERQMKAGRYRIEPAPEGAVPDLAGLSCRWTPMKARNGSILSILVLPRPGAAPAAVAAVSHRVVAMTRELAGGGHPVPPEGPSVTWPNDGIAIEAHASRGKGSLLRRKIELLATTLIANFFFVTRMKTGVFDPTHYIKVTRDNADFRKFDDGLKMTIDCDPRTRTRIEAVLQEASAAGIVSYGLFEQDAAIMTCIVPSVTSDNHVHFIDGAAGGYTSAAMAIKDHPQTEPLG